MTANSLTKMETNCRIFNLRICLPFAILEYSFPDFVRDTSNRCMGTDVTADYCVKTLSSDPRSRTTDLGGALEAEVGTELYVNS